MPKEKLPLPRRVLEPYRTNPPSWRWVATDAVDRPKAAHLPRECEKDPEEDNPRRSSTRNDGKTDDDALIGGRREGREGGLAQL